MTPGFVEFEFDLPDALLNSLVKIFDGMAAAPLVLENVQVIPEAQGVYQLLLNDKIVYIGKTDAQAGLRKRLERHAWTIQHRRGLNHAEVMFRAVRVFVFTAIDLETQLIEHYGTTAPVPWNNSGFGSNDPGRNRDDTNLLPEGFDAQFPIDLDHDVAIHVADGASAATVLAALRQVLPYTLRSENDGGAVRRPHPDLASAIVAQFPGEPRTTRAILSAVLQSLPSGWQATQLAGRVVLYKETRDYRYGTVIGRSSD